MIDQVIIGVCGISSVFLSQSKTYRVQRLACLFGITAQPAWFYTTLAAEQYGIFILSLIYTTAWCRGIWNFWIKPWMTARSAD